MIVAGIDLAVNGALRAGLDHELAHHSIVLMFRAEA
jgi:hypothetical protein